MTALVAGRSRFTLAATTAGLATLQKQRLSAAASPQDDQQLLWGHPRTLPAAWCRCMCRKGEFIFVCSAPAHVAFRSAVARRALRLADDSLIDHLLACHCRCRPSHVAAGPQQRPRSADAATNLTRAGQAWHLGRPGVAGMEQRRRAEEVSYSQPSLMLCSLLCSTVLSGRIVLHSPQLCSAAPKTDSSALGPTRTACRRRTASCSSRPMPCMRRHVTERRSRAHSAGCPGAADGAAVRRLPAGPAQRAVPQGAGGVPA